MDNTTNDQQPLLPNNIQNNQEIINQEQINNEPIEELRRPTPNTNPSPISASELLSQQKVTFNGNLVSLDDLLKLAENGQFFSTEDYWYDPLSGLYGLLQQPALGTTIAGLKYGKLAQNASNGDTKIFLNGRELHQFDILQFYMRGLQLFPGNWVMDERGTVQTEYEYLNLPTFRIIAVHRSTFSMTFETVTTFGKGKWVSSLTFSEFREFQSFMETRFMGIQLPEFPPRRFGLGSDEFIEHRRQMLENYIQFALNVVTIRECASAMQILHLPPMQTEPKTPSVTMKVAGETWEQPLISLDEMLRIEISSYYLLLARKWWDGELFDMILKRLQVQLGEIPFIDQPPESLLKLGEQQRWMIVWEILLSSFIIGRVDSRTHVSLQLAADFLLIPLKDLCLVEGSSAQSLHKKLLEATQPTENTKSSYRALKIGAGAAVGGGVLLVAGLLAAPLLVPVILAGTAVATSLATATFGATVAGGIAIAGTTLAAVAVPVLPILFGATGAGLVSYKVAKMTGGVKEFGFMIVPFEKIGDDDQIEREELQEQYEINWKTGEIEIKPNAKFNDVQMPAADQIEVKRQELLKRRENYLNNQQDSTYLHSIESINENENENEQNNESIDLVLEKQTTESNAGVRVYICCNGWLWKDEDQVNNWVKLHQIDPSAEIYSCVFERKLLKKLGRAVVNTVLSTAAVEVAKFWLVMVSTIAATALMALAWPLAAIGMIGMIDNQWSLVSDRAEKCGKLLASALLEKAHGNRPVTLIGFSHGARLIFYALEEMAKYDCEGIIENVYLIGAPVSSEKERWQPLKRIVAGRLVNAYSKSDWVLGLVHRVTSMSADIAGLEAIDCEGIENIDLTELIGGHLNQRSKLDVILEYLEVYRSIPSKAIVINESFSKSVEINEKEMKEQ